jgi:hypothetical protein
LDRNDEVPSQAKDTLTENRVIYPYSLLLCREAKHLKYINGKKIDHAKGECFTGETKFSLLTGEEISFEESRQRFGNDEFWVYSFDIESGGVVPGMAQNLDLVDSHKETIVITLDNGESIECSLDHKFLLKNKTYKEANDLEVNDSLMSFRYHTQINKAIDKPTDNNHKVMSIVRTKTKKEMYCIHVERYNNFALTAGVFVHNSKDLWDGFAGVIYGCELNDSGQGSFELIDFDY